MIIINIEYNDKNVLYGQRSHFKITIEGIDENLSKERLNKIIDTIQEVLF